MFLLSTVDHGVYLKYKTIIDFYVILHRWFIYDINLQSNGQILKILIEYIKWYFIYPTLSEWFDYFIYIKKNV